MLDWHEIISLVLLIVKFILKVNQILEAHLQRFDPPVRALAIFGLIDFPIFYIVFHFHRIQIDTEFIFRSIATILCLLLLLWQKLPKIVRPSFPLLWYATLTFCFPFFGTYLFLLNHASIVWISNFMLIIILMILCTDWISFIVVNLIGCSLGALFFYLEGGVIYSQTPHITLTLINYAWAIVIAAFFARSREISEHIKQETLRSVAATIAHELRTPLFALGSAAAGLKKLLPKLIANYHATTQKNASPKINDRQMELLKSLPEEMSSIVNSGLTFIDMFVQNSNLKPINKSAFSTLTIQEVVSKSLNLYPFDEEDKALINFDSTADFKFRGIEIYIIHILFNLIKNSLYSIKDARKGDITIWVEPTDTYNILHFKDTGKGVPAEILERIFDPFYSRTQHGTGIGLSFCKNTMRELDGNIMCESQEGEYAHFRLIFPKLY